MFSFCARNFHTARVWLIRTEDSWVGDLIGGLSIVVSLIGGLLIGHAMSGGGL